MIEAIFFVLQLMFPMNLYSMEEEQFLNLGTFPNATSEWKRYVARWECGLELDKILDIQGLEMYLEYEEVMDKEDIAKVVGMVIKLMEE